MEIKNINDYSTDELLKLVLSNQIRLNQMVEGIQNHLYKVSKEGKASGDNEIYVPQLNGQEVLEQVIKKLEIYNEEIDFYLKQN
jgi:hypothetical protein